jgi:DNA polymerase III epsilon subunit-like protein
VETTGIDPRRDRVIEIALIQLAPSRQPRHLRLRLNPEGPIPAAASAVHGIFDEHVARCPIFAELAAAIGRFFDGADISGFGVARFDLPFLAAEYERVGWEFPLDGRNFVDALTLFHRLEPRDLAAASAGTAAASTPPLTGPVLTWRSRSTFSTPCSEATLTCRAALKNCTSSWWKWTSADGSAAAATSCCSPAGNTRTSRWPRLHALILLT